MATHELPRSISQPLLSRLGKALARATQTLLEWQQRQVARRQLLSFDERALKDIGVSSADATREAGKLFWHE